MKNNLETQVEDLTSQLQQERDKARRLTAALGQMRYRVIEVLDLADQDRKQIIIEIDTVFNRML